MLQHEFNALAQQGFNRIPVFRQVLADLDTPVSAYIKLASGPYSYLFESVQGGEKWGRYSMIGLPCSTVIKVYGHRINIETDGKLCESFEVEDPLAYISEYQSAFKVAQHPELPVFQGGLVGYFAYDTVRYVEHRLQGHAPHDALQSPDILLMVSEEVLVFDNLAGTMNIIVLADTAKDNAFTLAQSRLDDIVRLFDANIPPLSPINVSVGKSAPVLSESSFISGFCQQDFESAVCKIKDYILAGDVMQVVISQRLTIPFQENPLQLYRALRNLNPSPYMYFLDLGDTHIVGSSPEILARMQDNIVTVRPLAGTRPRGLTEEQDIALEQELLNDPKEIAEHLMLIDLGRNDVGRVAKAGSVKLSDKMSIERYSHVMHIVSQVEGELNDHMQAMDVLKAALPAGTLSGAPKVRAMEIIDELEPVKRGIYGGAVGYLSWNGNMDTAIAIRTAVIKDGSLHIQAGAGIVADSVPSLEWQETMNKARAMFKAVAMVQAQTPVKETSLC